MIKVIWSWDFGKFVIWYDHFDDVIFDLIEFIYFLYNL